MLSSIHSIRTRSVRNCGEHGRWVSFDDEDHSLTKREASTFGPRSPAKYRAEEEPYQCFKGARTVCYRS